MIRDHDVPTIARQGLIELSADIDLRDRQRAKQQPIAADPGVDDASHSGSDHAFDTGYGDECPRNREQVDRYATQHRVGGDEDNCEGAFNEEHHAVSADCSLVFLSYDLWRVPARRSRRA
jgi:hypothetical protein